MGVVFGWCSKTEEFDRIAYFVQEYMMMMMMMMTTDNFSTLLSTLVIMAYYEWKKVYKSEEMRSLQLFTFIVTKQVTSILSEDEAKEFKSDEKYDLFK